MINDNVPTAEIVKSDFSEQNLKKVVKKNAAQKNLEKTKKCIEASNCCHFRQE